MAQKPEKSVQSIAPEPASALPPWLRQIVEARRAACSLVFLTTLDAPAAIHRLCETLLVGGDAEAPVLEWDITRGAVGRNRAGEAGLRDILPQGVDAITATGALPEFLSMAPRLPARTILFLHNLQLYLDNPGVQQGLHNLRDPWLQKRGMVIGLGPEVALPPTLVNDMLVFDEPAPDDTTISQIVETRLRTADKLPEPAIVAQATLALRGVGSPFLIDQIMAMSSRKGVVRMPELLSRKRQTINAVKGLSVWDGDITSLAGQDVLRHFTMSSVENSPEGPPAAFVFIDEVEKSLGGAGTQGAGDSSGVSQDQLGMLLKMLEDWGSLASLFMGVGGVAKTAFVRWVAKQLGIMLIDFDLGSMKGSYVGQSEQQLRMAARTLRAISGGRPGALWFFFVCNQPNVLPPEFKRRMNMGMWFFDLPRGREGRDPIWAIHRDRYKIPTADDVPDDRGWTGAEIRNACQIAWRLKIPLVEAAKFIVPLVASEGGPDGAIERLHKLAHQRFLSVDHPGHYDHVAACPNAPGSKVEVPATQGGRAIEEE